MAVLLAGDASPAIQSQAAPPPPTAPAANGSTRSRSQEIVCRNYAVTGSRFTHRRCRTREQAQIAADEAQSFMRDGRRSSPSVEEIVNPLERSWIPE